MSEAAPDAAARVHVWETLVTCPRCGHPIQSPSRRFAWRVAEIVQQPRAYCRRCRLRLSVSLEERG